MSLLATAFPSDGKFDDIYYYSSFWLWTGSCLCAVVTAVLWIFPTLRRKLAPTVALVAVAVSLYPIIFSSYLYHIDFVEVGRDGTRASPPYWKALWLVWLPLLLPSLFLIYRGISKITKIGQL